MIIEIKDTNGKVVGTILVNPKVFSTGSRGFYGNGKVVIDNKRYQVNVQLVEIGSKPQV